MIHNFKNWNRLNETEVDANKLMLKLLNNDVTSSYVITKIQEAIKNNFKTIIKTGSETIKSGYFTETYKWKAVVSNIIVEKGTSDNKLIAKVKGYVRVSGDSLERLLKASKLRTLYFSSYVPVETVMADDGKNIKYSIHGNQISISTRPKTIKVQQSGNVIKLSMSKNVAIVKLSIDSGKEGTYKQIINKSIGPELSKLGTITGLLDLNDPNLKI
jgi:hypothetical protein